MLTSVVIHLIFVLSMRDEMSDATDPQLRNRLKELNVRESHFSGPIIPILVLACNRINVSDCLDDLIRYRPNSHQFPIIVSQVFSNDLIWFMFLALCRFEKPIRFQDCDHEPTKNVIKSYKDVIYMRQPNQTKAGGYYRIARHYKWALDITFDAGFEYLIIVEGELGKKERSLMEDEETETEIQIALNVIIFSFQMIWIFHTISMNTFWQHINFSRMIQRFGASQHGMIMDKSQILTKRNQNYCIALTFSLDLVGCWSVTFGMNYQWNGRKRRIINLHFNFFWQSCLNKIEITLLLGILMIGWDCRCSAKIELVFDQKSQELEHLGKLAFQGEDWRFIERDKLNDNSYLFDFQWTVFRWVFATHQTQWPTNQLHNEEFNVLIEGATWTFFVIKILVTDSFKFN